jgi:hypothetical protein
MLPTIIWGSDSVKSRAASANATDRATTRASRSHEYPRDRRYRADQVIEMDRRAFITALGAVLAAPVTVG